MLLAKNKEKMVSQIALQNYRKNIEGSALYSILQEIPREFFVPPSLQKYALKNLLIPIEYGSYIERWSEQLGFLYALNVEKHHKILEIGTGSGYSAALLSKLAARVITIECYISLAKDAIDRFKNLSIQNVICKNLYAQDIIAKGTFYDRIIIWPSVDRDPLEFLELLSIDGKLIVPIGQAHWYQDVTLYHHFEEGIKKEVLFSGCYQPLIVKKQIK